MSFLDLFRGKKEDEPSRIARLSKTGRTTEGTVPDVISDSSGQIAQVYYSYELGGVQYESSQELSRSQQLHTNDYIPGTRIVIRYDPRQHANSIVV